MRGEHPEIPEQWIQQRTYDGKEVINFALSPTTLVTADAKDWVSAESIVDASTVLTQRTYDFPIGQLGLSRLPSFLLVRSEVGDRLQIWQLLPRSSFQLTLEICGTSMAVGGFASHNGHDVLLATNDGRRLLAINPARGEPLAELLPPQTRSFIYRHFSSVDNGNSVIAVGYYAHEGKDSLIRLSMNRLLTEPDYLDGFINSQILATMPIDWPRVAPALMGLSSPGMHRMTRNRMTKATRTTTTSPGSMGCT